MNNNHNQTNGTNGVTVAQTPATPRTSMAHDETVQGGIDANKNEAHRNCAGDSSGHLVSGAIRDGVRSADLHGDLTAPLSADTRIPISGGSRAPATCSEENGWTKPYCGVQHFGYYTRFRSNGRWATATDRGSFAELDGWYQGCAFSPYTATFETIEEARAVGEAWTARGVFPQQEAA